MEAAKAMTAVEILVAEIQMFQRDKQHYRAANNTNASYNISYRLFQFDACKSN
tara:strand:+ start:3570 stop:3728 length:159 start_codon:yes stop_codon:yes gene_type:complete